MLTGWKEIEQKAKLTQKVLRPLINSAGFPVTYIGKTPISTAERIDEWVDDLLSGRIVVPRQ